MLRLGTPALTGCKVCRYTALSQTFGLSPTQLTLFNTASLLMSVRPSCLLLGARCCVGDTWAAVSHCRAHEQAWPVLRPQPITVHATACLFLSAPRAVVRGDVGRLWAKRAAGLQLLTALLPHAQSLFSPIAGLLGDRYHRGVIIGLGTLAWAATSVLFGLSLTYSQVRARARQPPWQKVYSKLIAGLRQSESDTGACRAVWLPSFKCSAYFSD